MTSARSAPSSIFVFVSALTWTLPVGLPVAHALSALPVKVLFCSRLQFDQLSTDPSPVVNPAAQTRTRSPVTAVSVLVWLVARSANCAPSESRTGLAVSTFFQKMTDHLAF